LSGDNQFQLLKNKKFLPFFLTQTFGALNDNIYKNALLITITFASLGSPTISVGVLTNLAAILFILPFFILSPLFGQLSDKYEKARSIRYIKIAEVIIVVLAIGALQTGNTYYLMGVLFLLGVQSAAFGPIKYSILPQHLSRTELTGGNGLVETGTFLAILIGTLLGGVLVSRSQDSHLVLSMVLLSVAIAGLLSSLQIPHSPAPENDLEINWNPLTQIRKTFAYVAEQKAVLQSVVGISWFWFYGSVVLTQIPNYTRSTLGADESVTTIILIAFSIGVGLGSLICNKLSDGRIEPGLVPIGAFGLSLFTVHLFFANQASGLTPVIGLGEFVTIPKNIRILVDITLVGFFGGIYVVPLYAIIQNRGNSKRLSRIISGGNILDALFIVISGLFAIILITLNLTVPQIFLATAIINVLVAAYIFRQVPEFIFRLFAWLCTRIWYKVDLESLGSIPSEGGCILIAGKGGCSEALVLAARLKRSAKFIFIQDDSSNSLLASLFLASGARFITEKALPALGDVKAEIKDSLKRGNIVCFFHTRQKASNTVEDLCRELEAYVSRLDCPCLPVAVRSVKNSVVDQVESELPLPYFLSGSLHVIAGEPISSQKFSFNDSSDWNSSDIEASRQSSRQQTQ